MDDDEAVDILFASTGAGRTSRFALRLRSPGDHGTLTTLLPIRAGDHALLLRLEPRWGGATGGGDDIGTAWPSRYSLMWAHGRGPWVGCGELAIDWSGPATDAPERFDPIHHPLPGTTLYPVVDGLRAPSSTMARRAVPRAGGPSPP